MKGAAEIVLKSCSHYLNENGEKTVLSDSEHMKIEKQIDNYAS